jgi:hypothetical protein
MDIIEVRQCIRRLAIADLGMAGSIVKQRKEALYIVEMLGLTAGHDW